MYNSLCMEEGGKKGGIPLDFEALFRNTDEGEAAPPQLVVVEEKKRRRKLPEHRNGDDDQEEESLKEKFKEFSDEKLREAIERQKKILAGNRSISDGGEKLLRHIGLQEAELKRRKSEKDNAKWEPKSDDRKCLGAHDGNQKEMRYQSNNFSTFGSSFLKKLGNPAKNVFGNELSTLNGCGHQKLISGGHDLSAKGRKGTLTLRRTQFISPENLSLHDDKCSLRKDDSKRRLSVTASPSCSINRVATKCSDKRRSSEAQALSDRRKHNTFVLVDLDEPDEAEMVPEVDQVDECLKDSRIYYPSSDDAESVEIRYSDLDCLGPEEYLTSTIINFYIRYLQQSRSSLSEQADNYHFFNTYFYEKLKEALEEENDNGFSFSKIRRWWKGVKLFEKSYIFLPIHEQSHWSLIIICMPEKEEGMGPIILHLDSLGFHHSKFIIRNIRRLLIGEWKFMVKEDPDPCLPFLRRIQENFHQSFKEMKVEVPQQGNVYDCGVFVLFFIELFIKMAPKRMKEEDLKMFGSQWFKPAEASRLRVTIRKLLKDEFKKAKEHNCLLDA